MKDSRARGGLGVVLLFRREFGVGRQPVVAVGLLTAALHRPGESLAFLLTDRHAAAPERPGGDVRVFVTPRCLVGGGTGGLHVARGSLARMSIALSLPAGTHLKVPILASRVPLYCGIPGGDKRERSSSLHPSAVIRLDLWLTRPVFSVSHFEFLDSSGQRGHLFSEDRVRCSKGSERQ